MQERFCLSHPENPTFEVCDDPFALRKRWLKELRQIARQIGFLSGLGDGPLGDTLAVLLTSMSFRVPYFY